MLSDAYTHSLHIHCVRLKNFVEFVCVDRAPIRSMNTRTNCAVAHNYNEFNGNQRTMDDDFVDDFLAELDVLKIRLAYVVRIHSITFRNAYL